MKDLPIVPGRGLVTPLSTKLRLEYLDSIKINTELISKSNIEIVDVQNKIESFIGSTEIPLGLVGPILFNESNKEEFVHCAVGTLEGALVASMNRGAKAISLGGGFSADIYWQKMCRAPMFLFKTEQEAIDFSVFTKSIFTEIKNVTKQYSNHADLIEIKIVPMNEVVNLKFIYTTGDASGQNMTTTCTWHAMLYIADAFKNETGIIPIDYVIEGNGSSDKKISNFNILNGRGINVTANCFLPESVISETLRTTSEKLIRCFKPSQELALQDGMVGYNINVANAIASIFVATGQDLASIHESGVGILQLEKKEDGLQLQLTLPNLVIGTVGGGTQLPKQRQALEMMNCLGSGKVERFAKLIAGFALGLEISTYSAIVSGEFAKAHEKLGRNKPVKWLLRSELTNEFLASKLNNYFDDKQIQKIEIVQGSLLENGIITNIASKISKKLIGFVPINITYLNSNNESNKLHCLLKSKAMDEEVIKGLHVIAASIDPELSDLLKENKSNLEYTNSHIKEIELYEYLNTFHPNITPSLYGIYKNENREIFFIIQELLDYSQLRIVNSENNPEIWEKENIIDAIDAIDQIHQTANLSAFPNVQEFKPWLSVKLYSKLISILIKDRPGHKNIVQLKSIIEQIDDLEKESKSIKLPKHITHNDFNPRNVAIRKNGNPVIYDWELAVVDFPHRDIVEFLSFVLSPNFNEQELFFYLKYHFSLYENQDWNEWILAYKYSLKVYIVSRISFYEVSGILIKYDFSARILDVAFRMLDILNNHE